MKRLVVLLAVLVLILAGCGSNAPEPTTTTTTTLLGSQQALPPGQFAEDSSMARMQKAGKLKVGVAFSQPPFGSKPGEAPPAGFDVEMAKLIAQGIFGGTALDAEQKIEWVEAVSANREAFLKDGTVDLVISTYGITPNRQLAVDFAGPYYVARGDLLIAGGESTIQGIADLNGKTVCTKSNSVFVQALHTQAPGATVITRDAIGGCLVALESREVAAVASEETILAGLREANPGKYRLLGTGFTSEPYGVGVKKGDKALVDWVNARLSQVQNEGDWLASYQATIGRLGLVAPQPPDLPEFPPTTTTTVPVAANTQASPTASSSAS